MNIQIAAKYMQAGYRIRRVAWPDDRYFCIEDYNEDRARLQLIAFLDIDNLVADDWELVPGDEVFGFPI